MNDPLVLPILAAGVLNAIAVAIGILIQNAQLTDFRNRLSAGFDRIGHGFGQVHTPKRKRRRRDKR